MDSIQFPENFVNLIFKLNKCFTKPSFKHFKLVLSGILIGGSKKTLTAGIRLNDLGCHFSNIYRFVSWYKWNLNQVLFSVLDLVNHFLALSKYLVFALDDTLVPKYGTKIFGRGCHFDHASKPNRPQYILGHNWVVLGLLYHWSLFSKWICFPILSRLFVPEKATSDPSLFKSRILIAVEMVAQLKDHLKQSFTLVADGLYAKEHLVRCCIENKITFISRLRNDAALYESVKPSGVKGRGRPRKYGRKIILAKEPKGFKTIYLKLYGERHKIAFKTVIAVWKPAGAPIKVFMVQFDDSKSLTYFFSTNLSLKVERILTLIAARWSIETLFSDMKEHLGMKDWQVRTENSVIRSVPITCIATSLLLLWSIDEAGRRDPEFWDIQPWDTKKSSPSLFDVMNQLKARCITNSIFDVLKKKGIEAQKYKEIETLLRRAA
jgi:hypothetical protein